MTLLEFKNSLTHSKPSAASDLLLAMWYDGKGDWLKAHDIAQEVHTKDGSWIHAYLHRKQGDLSNAQYWYDRANRKMPTYSLLKEWEELVITFLEKQ